MSSGPTGSSTGSPHQLLMVDDRAQDCQHGSLGGMHSDGRWGRHESPSVPFHWNRSI